MTTCIIPMAGAGRRFVQAGHLLPKYALRARGRPLLAWALASLPLPQFDRVVLVAQRDAVAAADPLSLLDRETASRVTEIVLLDGLTGGQADTVCAARHAIDERPLVVFNCDTHFQSPTLAARLADRDADDDGLIGSFAGAGSHWSFARVDAQGRVLETAEKRRISEHCLTGLYHFRRGSDFLLACDNPVPEAGETYVAPLYNPLIARGRCFRLDVVSHFVPLGTPAELAACEATAEGVACAA
ncbi:MAG: NTP transferase domain-containing protein [Rubrivivax sp.]|nr:NTP transferase domain-containing protein [Rubrivivax sp.]